MGEPFGHLLAVQIVIVVDLEHDIVAFQHGLLIIEPAGEHETRPAVALADPDPEAAIGPLRLGEVALPRDLTRMRG